jgi:large subunit ribosomal protein L25
MFLPKDLPEFITVDLADLTAGNTLHLSNLTVPKALKFRLSKGEDLPVATIVIPRGVAAEEAAQTTTSADVPTTVQKKEGIAKEGEKKDAGKKEAGKKK